MKITWKRLEGKEDVDLTGCASVGTAGEDGAWYWHLEDEDGPVTERHRSPGGLVAEISTDGVWEWVEDDLDDDEDDDDPPSVHEVIDSIQLLAERIGGFVGETGLALSTSADRIATALEAIQASLETALCKVYPEGMTPEQVNEETQAHPRVIRTGFLQAWALQQIQAMSAQAEVAKNQMIQMIGQSTRNIRRG